MGNTAIKAGILLLYIFMLSKIMNFKLWLIINPSFLIMVVSGAVLLAILGYRRGTGKLGFIIRLKWSVLISGCLTTFLEDVAYLSKKINDMPEIYNNIVNNFLPIFYAFFIYFTLELLQEPFMKSAETELPFKYDDDAERLEDYDLTRREVAVASEILKNLSNMEIGEKLFISENTVKKHINHIFQKVGVKNRTEFINKFHPKQ